MLMNKSTYFFTFILSINLLCIHSSCVFPNHVLRLKKGVPMMLLRNIDQTIGFCNNTRFIIVKLGVNIIGAEIISKMVVILCFDALIFVVKNRLCSINYSKKNLYVTLFKNYSAPCVAQAFCL